MDSKVYVGAKDPKQPGLKRTEPDDGRETTSRLTVKDQDSVIDIGEKTDKWINGRVASPATGP